VSGQDLETHFQNHTEPKLLNSSALDSKFDIRHILVLKNMFVLFSCMHLYVNKNICCLWPVLHDMRDFVTYLLIKTQQQQFN